MKYSFVIPCYRSENTIAGVVDEISNVLSQRNESDYEIILVNDCSPDNVWHVIQELSKKDNRIKGICLSRNFGQHSALLAGYRACGGEFIVSLDDDGQCPVDEFYRLVDKLEEGYDAVYAEYEEIKQNNFRKFGTWMTDVMARIMMDKPKELKLTSFYIARRFIINEMIKYNNSYAYIPGLLLRTTKNISNVVTHQRKRREGKSGYSFVKLLSLWINGFTAFSVKPLEIGIYVGVVFAIMGFAGAGVTIIRKIVNPAVAAGWSSIISVVLLIGGIILVMLGLIGEYIGRIYICINNAPQYVIRETKGFEKLELEEAML